MTQPDKGRYTEIERAQIKKWCKMAKGRKSKKASNKGWVYSRSFSLEASHFSWAKQRTLMHDFRAPNKQMSVSDDCNHRQRKVTPLAVATRSKAERLRPLPCWDCGFESHRGHWSLSVVGVCCPVEFSATSWSPVQSSPTDCGASLCVIYEGWNFNSGNYLFTTDTK